MSRRPRSAQRGGSGRGGARSRPLLGAAGRDLAVPAGRDGDADGAPKTSETHAPEPRASAEAATDPAFDLFFAVQPGLEPVLLAEARALGFAGLRAEAGGVAARGGWSEVWRANLWLRGASRVLLRVGAFRAPHLAQLDKRARRLPWETALRPDAPVRVEATCRRSRIYHAGAAAQRVARAIRETVGAEAGGEDAIRVLARIEDDLCTISVDTSGAPLHRRGLKQDVGAAPLRETLAALFLRACGWDGTTPLIDPMCGGGTLPIAAAEIACGLAPGRARGFAFERMAGFDPAAWAAHRDAPPPPRPTLPLFGMDRDAGAIARSQANAERAGVADRVAFRRQPISDLAPPEALAGLPPGLVIANPPYGARLGAEGPLRALYGTFGAALKDRFRGWRVGLITASPALAKATGLPFGPPGSPVPHG